MSKACFGDYPEWGCEKDYINPIPPEMCQNCPWLETCMIRVGFLMNYEQELTEQELEAIQGGIREERTYIKTLH